MKWFRWLLCMGLNKEEANLANDLKRNGIYSARVVGRGTLICDPAEVIASEKFRRLSEEARELIHGKDS